MTLDGFLTALTLVVALFALVPSVQRMRARSSAPAQLLIGAVAFLGVLWLELYEPSLTCPWQLGAACDWLALDGDNGGVARKGAFLVVLLWAGLAFAVHRFRRVGAGSVPKLSSLASSLVDEGRLGEALTLIAPHVDLFVAVSRRQGRWQQAHDYLATFGHPLPRVFDMGLNPRADSYPGKRWPQWARGAVRMLSAVVPKQADAETAALDTFRLIHRSPQILSFLAEQRPYLALPFIGAETYSRGEFFDIFLTHLIAHPGSVLYQELEQNQNLDYPIGYYLPPSNRLLHFLFFDAEIALNLGAWSPVGDYLERLLDGMERAGYVLWLNDSAKWFEREWWRDPTFVGIFYFDVMVTSAIRQNIADHMWLFYFPHFAERLARLYDSSNETVDRTAEFPTRAARLLYEIVDRLNRWVASFTELPAGSPHREFPDCKDHTGKNIPLSASRALGSTLFRILLAEQIDVQFMQTVHDTTVRMIRNLPLEGASAALRPWVIKDIVDGGDAHLNSAYRQRLRALFENTDYVLRFEVKDYAVAIGAEL
jgi:hypothetical protein